MAKSKSIRDEQLVRLAKKGDTRAFGKLMLRYQNKIYRLARRMTDTDEDAEDVLQDAFIKAFRKLSTFKERSKFSTWLYRITVNIALMKLRRRKLSTVSLSEPVETEDSTIQRDIENGSPDPLAKLLGAESAEILDKAINGLRPSYRAVFVLRHVEGLSTRETARVVGIDVPAVKSRLHRARRQLKVQLLGSKKNQTTRGKVA
ncbi:MAG: sigma-70 family RNA polymerase sigma factor [Candidatus Eisenbacteria bacterium]